MHESFVYEQILYENCHILLFKIKSAKIMMIHTIFKTYDKLLIYFHSLIRWYKTM